MPPETKRSRYSEKTWTEFRMIDGSSSKWEEKQCPKSTIEQAHFYGCNLLLVEKCNENVANAGIVVSVNPIYRGTNKRSWNWWLQHVAESQFFCIVAET